jgi:G3E family GTPase
VTGATEVTGEFEELEGVEGFGQEAGRETAEDGRAPTGRPIPVVVVAGFLGSGKTTLLNHLLHHAGDARVAVAVNDFGSVNIDAMLVSAQVGSTVQLTGGCLCCVLDTEDIDGMFTRLADARPDVVVLEASGLAEPADVVRMVLASREPRVAYGGLVLVVDGAEFPATRERHPGVDRHVAGADLVVLNKADRVDAAAAANLRRVLAELAPGVPIVLAEHGRVDPALLFEPGEPGETEDSGGPGTRAPRPRQLSFADLLREDDDHADHPHAAYDTITLTADRPLHPGRLMAFLDARPPGVYRMKGFVDLALPGADDRFGLHTVGRHLRFTRTPWPDGRPPATTVVAIGTDLDETALRARFTACARADGEDVGEYALDGLLRYVRP